MDLPDSQLEEPHSVARSAVGALNCRFGPNDVAGGCQRSTTGEWIPVDCRHAPGDEAGDNLAHCRSIWTRLGLGPAAERIGAQHRVSGNGRVQLPSSFESVSVAADRHPHCCLDVWSSGTTGRSPQFPDDRRTPSFAGCRHRRRDSHAPSIRWRTACGVLGRGGNRHRSDAHRSRTPANNADDGCWILLTAGIT